MPFFDRWKEKQQKSLKRSSFILSFIVIAVAVNGIPSDQLKRSSSSSSSLVMPS